MIIDERSGILRKNALLVQQIEELIKESQKHKDQEEQLKERLKSVRALNKQLESKSQHSWQVLKRGEVYQELEQRCRQAEERVHELETSLSDFIEDFELLNTDLSVCAQKLAASEAEVETLKADSGRREELQKKVY